MPRAKVPPGRSPKRSASSASSWRRPNLSCCATSGSPRPRSWRAAASSAPTPVPAPAPSLFILAALHLAELLRLREAPAQLRGVALLGDALPLPALDAQREPERLGVRRHQLVVARHQRARILDPALPVADLAERQQRHRVVGLQAQRALEELLRVLDVL